MQNYSYDNSSSEQYIEDKKIFSWNTNPYQLNFDLKREQASTPNNYHDQQNLTRSQLAHLRESPAAKQRRLARNAERMREKRARESDDERRKRLDKNALNNRLKRLNESPTEKAIRQVRDAARQRLRRAMESTDQRERRLRKLAERMRTVRRNEAPDRKADRLARAAQRARERLQRETSEERRIRLSKGSEYARRVRSKKSTTGSSISNDLSSDNSDNLSLIYHNSNNIDQKPTFSNLKIPQHHPQQQQQQQQQQPQPNSHHMQNINLYDNHHHPSTSANYNFVNFNNSISALTFNHNDASSITQPMNNSLITLNIPHYHTVFSSQPPPSSHQAKNFNATTIKEEFYPKINPCDNMNQLKHRPSSSSSSMMKSHEVIEHNFQSHIKTENNLPKQNEHELQRLDRLRKTAELSRLRRNNETPEQRLKRLNDLKSRARRRREEVKKAESDEERKVRLAKQAEYARTRRQKDTSRPPNYPRIGESPLLNSDKPSNTDIRTIATFDTEYSADSVEWLSSDIFAVGTYQLDENDKNVNNTKSIRKGRIFLFKFDFESEDYKLQKLQQIETDAILDQKWFDDRLVTVSSLGNVEIYKYDDEKLEKCSKISLMDEDDGDEILALSIDVDIANEKFLVSDSRGQISLIDASSQVKLSQWNAHTLNMVKYTEAWSCAFDRWNSNVVYSGGDDSRFNVWDLRSSSKIKSKSRDAGVTSFLNHKENMLLVGSYDEMICLYDTRNLKQTVDEINLQGGIWRIKQSRNDEKILLVACMYKNFSFVECASNLTLIGEYNEHKSICYGCDFSFQAHDEFKFFACCSFYDHKLSVGLLKYN